MEKIAEKCLNNGFSFAKVIETKDIVFMQEVRAACEQNSCGKFGKSWTCPPALKPIEEMEKEIKKNEKGVIVQFIGQLEDSFDYEGMVEISDNFRKLFYKTIDELKSENPAIVGFGAGSCGICKLAHIRINRVISRIKLLLLSKLAAFT